MNLTTLQLDLLAERERLMEEFKDEIAREEIANQLDEAYEKLKDLHNKLDTLRRNAEDEKAARPSLPSTRQRTIRKRPNPEFARLGIPIPAGQRPGNTLYPVGTKPKRNRRTRKTRK